MASLVTMRYMFSAFPILLLSLVCTVSAIWLPSSVADTRNRLLDLLNQDSTGMQGSSKDQNWLLQIQQHIMEGVAPNTVVTPPLKSPDEDVDYPHGPPGKGHPIVSDVLPKTRAINVFASLTRDFEPIASRLNDASQNITVLAPRNSAIQALPRKPWESPEEYEQFGSEAYEGERGQDRAKRNLQRFVEAHLIPVSPWRKDEEVETLAGQKLKWTKDGDKIFVSTPVVL